MRRPIASVLILTALVSLAPPRLAAQPAVPERAARERAADQKLGNAGLEVMLDAGLAPEIIIAKIKTSDCSFDTSAGALRRLKAKGATEEVLLAVVRSAVDSQTVATRQPAPPAPARPPAAPKTVVPAGTPVEVEAAHQISSAEVRAGDTLSFRVARPVGVGGLTVIAQGAVATARVVEAKKGRPFGKAGRLAFEMLDVEAADGRKVPLTFAEKLKGDSKGGTVATAIAITAVFAFPAAPLWGFKRGKSAVIPPGRIFAAAVRADTPVEVSPPR